MKVSRVEAAVERSGSAGSKQTRSLNLNSDLNPKFNKLMNSNTPTAAITPSQSQSQSQAASRIMMAPFLPPKLGSPSASLSLLRSSPLSVLTKCRHSALCSSFHATAALVVALCCLLSPSSCSPPVDFLVHTSQLATASNDANHNITSMLHSLESIYFSLASNNDSSSNTGNQETTTTSSTTATSSANQAASGKSEQLRQLASKVLAIVKDVGHTHDNDRAADLEITRFAWHLMEKQALAYAQDRVHTIKPLVGELLRESQASSQCQESLLTWLDRFAKLDDWALTMWNAWGDFPAAGLFEGSFTDLGSYKGCINVRDNPAIGQTQYCTLDFEPIVPTRARFHSVFKQILAVDPKTRQLTGGDFHHLQPTGERPRSQTAAHAFKSSRFYGPESEQKAPTLPLATDQLKFNTSAIEELAKIAHYFYYVKLRVGSCWPTKCSRHDIQNIVQTAGAFAVLRANEPFCTKRNPQNVMDRMNNYQILAVLILSGLALVTVAATCLDLAQDMLFFFGFKRQAKWILQKFNLYMDTYSLCKNMARLFSVSSSKSSAPPISSTTTTMTDGKQQELPAKQLTCLHGLKFISMIWVIYGHTLLFSDYQSYSHPMRTIEGNIANIWTLPSLIPNFSVDTFFVISGLLSAYIIFSLNVKFNGFLYTVARYIRLTPQLFIVILLFFLLPLMGDGPIYKQGTETQANNCMNNFWLNLLYLQSYVNRRDICLIPSWWLSIEMTFHLISLFVIYLLIKSPRWGMIANWLVILAMTLIGSVYHYTHGFAIQYLPSIPQKYEVEYEQTQYFFHMPYPHAPSFFIGLALGYVLAKGSIRRLGEPQLYVGWISSVAIFVVCLLGSYCWNLGAPYTQLEATIYYNLCQVLWPVAISWIILTCSLGQGGFVNSILSADFFIPFGRITYMTYLSHMVVVYFYAASIQQTFEPNFLNMTYVCATNGILSIILGAVLSLVYEAPLLNIQRIILEKKYGKVEPIRMTSTANGIRNKLILNSADSLKPNNSSNSNSNNNHNHSHNHSHNHNHNYKPVATTDPTTLDIVPPPDHEV